MNPRFYPALRPRRLGNLARHLGCALPQGAEGDSLVSGLKEVREARAGDLCFLEDNRRVAALTDFDPKSVCITTSNIADYCLEKKNSVPLFLIVDSPKLAWCEAVDYLLAKEEEEAPSLDPRAIIATNAILHPSALVGPYVVIEEKVEIGANTTIEPFCLITRGCQIGASCRIGANTRISHTIIEDDVQIQSGCNIGEPDFGVTRDKNGKPRHFPQLGCIRIKRGSRLFCDTVVGRGTIEDTIIGENVHVGAKSYVSHNLRVGDCTIIAPRAALSGSTRIGRYVTAGGSLQTAQNVRIGDRVGIGGRCSVWPHVRIADDVRVMNESSVIKDAPQKGATLFGNPAIPMREELRRRRELDKLTKRKSSP